MTMRFPILFSASLLPAAVVLLLSSALLSQSEASNWNFGLNVSVSFIGGEPQLNVPVTVEAFEGCVSLSDSLGNLLFYSNGGGTPDGSTPGTIWNAAGGVMYDMAGTEGGGNSARQSAIAFPAPNSLPGRYYLFTVDDQESRSQPGGSNGMRYFVIDMTANGGLGAVIAANVPAEGNAVEALDATPMAGGNGYWVVSHGGSDDLPFFVIVPVTDAGVTPATVVETGRAIRGIIRFSPDGRYLYNNGFVYAFDAATGQVGDLVIDLSLVDKNSVTFSADSRYIVARNDNNLALGAVITRYEVETGEELPIGILGGADPADRIFSSTFQLGPNGNVYFVGNQFATGREGLFEVRCVSTSDPELISFLLDFPAGSVSAFPSNPPNYVDAIFRQPVELDTLRPDTVARTLCSDSRARLETDAAGTNYRWSTGDTTRNIAIPGSGSYSVTVTGGCIPTVEVTDIVLLPTPVAEIVAEGGDAGCSADTVELVLSSNLPPDSIRWSNGATTDTIRVPIVLGTRLSATVFTNCGMVTAGYAFPETDPVFEPTLSFPEGAVCPGDELTYTIELNGGEAPTSILWFNGDATLTTTFPSDSTRPVSVELVGPCGDTVLLTDEPAYLENCNCRDAVPEVFSPNSDGRNDVFGLFTDCRTDSYQLTVFNRWGNKVFSTDDFGQRWDGNTDGKPQIPDVYYYVINFRYAGQPEVLRRDGEIMLVR